MNHQITYTNKDKYIYYILILTEYLHKNFGIHFPKEIVTLIIIVSRPQINISCGLNHTYLMCDEIYAWGANRNGRLGLELELNEIQSYPHKFDLKCLAKNEKIKSICCGWFHVVVLSTFNKIYQWRESKPIERILQTRSGICTDTISEIKSGSHFIVILTEKKIYTLGRNAYGQLGIGNNADQDMIRGLVLNKPGFSIKTVTCGGSHVIAITTIPNKMYVWGRNREGQLGLGDCKDRYSPQELILSTAVISVSCGECHSVAIIFDSTELLVWGDNEHGQLGLGNCKDRNIPHRLRICEDDEIVSVSCGGFFTLALMKSGKMYSWGQNSFGQLGLGHLADKNVPQEIVFKEKIVSVNCGGYHSIVVTSNYHIWVWGRNNVGQLGLGHTEKHIYNEPQQLIF